MSARPDPERGVVLLVDDLRSFVDRRPALVARTGNDGVRLLQEHRGRRVEELWLDHDLGGDDTVWPVVEVLEEAAFRGEPYDIGCVLVHSANPPGAAAVHRALVRWSYRTCLVSGTAHLGHLNDDGG